MISLFLFLIEIILASLGVPDYLNSFFFWLDLVSTLSIVTDIQVFMTWLTGLNESDNSSPSNPA